MARSPKTNRYERDIEAARRDAEAADLRCQGKQYAEIAAIQGTSKSAAYERVWRAIRSAPVEAGEHLRDLELARLDALIDKAWAVLTARHPLVSNGRRFDDLEDCGPVLAAIRELRMLSESRRKLLGLDAPTRATVTVLTEDVVDAAIKQLEAEVAERDRDNAPAS